MGKTAQVVPQVLLLGAAGTLGGAILRELQQQAQSLPSPQLEVIPKTKESLNICCLEETRRQIRLLKPAVVINATGYTHVMEAERDQRTCWETNVRAVDNLIKSCATEDVPLIHISTGSVFGDMLQDKPRVESDPLYPTGVYAQSKAASELALLGVGQMVCPEFRNMGFRYWLIRTSYLFGPAAFTRHRNPFAQTLDMAQCRSQQDHLVPADVYRSITYAPHLAKAIVWLASHTREVVSGVYHIANRGHDSLYRYHSLLFSLAGGSRGTIKAASLQETAKAMDFDARIMPRHGRLNCDKWHEIAPFKMPKAEEALEEFAVSL